LRDRSL